MPPTPPPNLPPLDPLSPSPSPNTTPPHPLPPQRVLLTGASGFVGQAVLASLLSAGHHVHTLTRKPLPHLPHLTPFTGDILSPDSLLPAATGCTAAIHLVGIIAEHPQRNSTFHSIHVQGTQNVLSACLHASIPRYIHMSALGTRPDAPSAYHQSKHQAEQLVRASPLDYTIFRPSMITGPNGEFTRMVRAWSTRQAAPYFFFPYFRPGLLGLGPPTLVQPISLSSVARAFTESLSLPASIHQTYNLAGPTPLTWPQFYHALSTHFRFPPKPSIPIPIWYAKLLTRLAPPSLLPFNLSQVQMASENNTTTDQSFPQTFHWTPTAFD